MTNTMREALTAWLQHNVIASAPDYDLSRLDILDGVTTDRTTNDQEN